LLEKEQEETLVKHSLREVQDQGVFIEKDQAKIIAHRDSIQDTYHQLMKVNRDVQNELDFMLKVDRNLTTKLEVRNKEANKALNPNVSADISSPV
jgi:hypothetical protein